MTLPAPKLDDRRFQDLVDEAKLRVQHHCDLHGWTDHNVSDPGVMLIETFAWMTDQLLYRLNRVPDLNYVKFLELLGVTLLPPTAAITDLTFWLSKAQPEDKLVIPARTQVSSARSGSGEQITFATTAALPIVPCSLELLKSVDHSGKDVKVRRNDDGQHPLLQRPAVARRRASRRPERSDPVVRGQAPPLLRTRGGRRHLARQAANRLGRERRRRQGDRAPLEHPNA